MRKICKKAFLTIAVIISMICNSNSSFADWVIKDEKIYYIDQNDNIAIGWQTIDNKQYYFMPDGEMVTKSTIIESIRYKFNSDGVCQGKYTGWTKSASKGKRYWKNGELITNKWIRTTDGTRYYAGEDGYIIKAEYSDEKLLEIKQLISSRRKDFNIGVYIDHKNKKVVVDTEQITLELLEFINSLECYDCVVYEISDMTIIND